LGREEERTKNRVKRKEGLLAKENREEQFVGRLEVCAAE